MSMPFYVSPEQSMRDKADYARKGIARGRSCVALQYAGGILLVAPNPSSALHKISEIYDRIGFAAVGRYNEYENLRVAGWLYRKESDYLKAAIAQVLEYFPILETRWDTSAGSLSGGEQQMLSLAQAFIARP